LQTLIDSARFVKFFRDQNLLSKSLSVTDLDILFNKAKVWAKRSDRKLDYRGFVYAIKLAANTKFSAPSGDSSAELAAYQQLLTEICANVEGPKPNKSLSQAKVLILCNLLFLNILPWTILIGYFFTS
jgi:hypothetical protein